MKNKAVKIVLIIVTIWLIGFFLCLCFIPNVLIKSENIRPFVNFNEPVREVFFLENI